MTNACGGWYAAAAVPELDSSRSRFSCILPAACKNIAGGGEDGDVGVRLQLRSSPWAKWGTRNFRRLWDKSDRTELDPPLVLEKAKSCCATWGGLQRNF